MDCGEDVFFTIICCFCITASSIVIFYNEFVFRLDYLSKMVKCYCKFKKNMLKEYKCKCVFLLYTALPRRGTSFLYKRNLYLHMTGETDGIWKSIIRLKIP